MGSQGIVWDSQVNPTDSQKIVWDSQQAAPTPAPVQTTPSPSGQQPQDIEGYLAQKAKEYPVAATIGNYAKRIVKTAIPGLGMIPDNTIAGATASTLHAANSALEPVRGMIPLPWRPGNMIPQALQTPPKGVQAAFGAWAPRQVEEGTKSAIAGAKQVVAPPVPMNLGESVPSAMARDIDARAGALSDTGRGIAQAVSPLAIAGMAASPLAAGAAIAGGGLADLAANKTASWLGAGPGVSKLTGDAAGLVAGGKLANKVAGTDVAKSLQGAMFGDPDPLVMMVRAAKPRSGNTNFKENLAISMPELKSVESRLGRPVERIEDLVSQPGEEPALIDIAKRANREVYDHVRGPQVAMSSQIDVTPVGKAMKAVIPKQLYFENPQAAARLEAAADKYSGNLPMEDVEAFLKTANAKLDAFYDMNPAARRSAVAANPELAQTDAQAKIFRELIYKKLDEPGGGEAARALQKRYGALLELEDALLRRRNVAMRQQPDNISEQAAKWSGYGQAVKGAAKMLSGEIRSGGADVLSGLFKPEAAKWIKEQQTSNSLIKRAFEKFKGQQENLNLPVDPRIQMTADHMTGENAPRQIEPPAPGEPPLNVLVGKSTGNKVPTENVPGDLPSTIRPTPMGPSTEFSPKDYSLIMGSETNRFHKTVPATVSGERQALRNGLLQRFAGGRKFEDLQPGEQAKLDDFITENLNKPAPTQKTIDIRPWMNRK